MRKGHYLKKNKRVELPQHMIFVDTETKGVKQNDTTEHHYLWFGWSCYTRIRNVRGKSNITTEWFRFTTALQFWEWVEHKSLAKTRFWILAHNWNFDAGILSAATIPEARGWEREVYINDKPPFIVTFRKDGRTLRLIDSLNYFAGSLADIGESIGISKLAMPNATNSTSDWDTYCKRDVGVIKDAFLKFRDFVEEHQLGNFQSTLASQAMTAFRHRFMKHQILIHPDEQVCQLEREGYHGGRTECFYLGDVNQPLWYLDVNSLYPSVMLDRLFPRYLVRSRRKIPMKDILEWRENHALMIEVKVKTDEPIYPKRIDGRLCFPIGSFWTTLTTPEFDIAFESGHIQETGFTAVYETASLFREYVSYFYKLRQEYKSANNDTFQYMCKIFLNSFYGKFGQNGQKWQDVENEGSYFPGIITEWDDDLDRPRKIRWRLGQMQALDHEGESENSFPAIAAHVTAYGRLLMWDLIMKAGKENAYYMDTDSLVVNRQGFDNLSSEIDPTELGKLAIEATADTASFYGPKDYHFGQTERHKGIRKTAKRLAENRWQQEKFATWDYLVSKGNDGYIPISSVTKTLHRVYRKGDVTRSGVVQPFTLDE